MKSHKTVLQDYSKRPFMINKLLSGGSSYFWLISTAVLFSAKSDSMFAYPANFGIANNGFDIWTEVAQAYDEVFCSRSDLESVGSNQSQHSKAAIHSHTCTCNSCWWRMTTEATGHVSDEHNHVDRQSFSSISDQLEHLVEQCSSTDSCDDIPQFDCVAIANDDHDSWNPLASLEDKYLDELIGIRMNDLFTFDDHQFQSNQPCLEDSLMPMFNGDFSFSYTQLWSEKLTKEII